MKTIATNSLVGKSPRQAKLLRDLRLRAMECRVKAGHLRQVRGPLADRSNRRQIMWLVQRRQRRQIVQLRQHGIVNPHGGDKLDPAMNHPVPDGDEAMTAQPGLALLDNYAERLLVIDRSTAIQIALLDDFPARPRNTSRGRVPIPAICPRARGSPVPTG